VSDVATTAPERLYIGISPMVKSALEGFKISRAVRAGSWLFTNGQMDLGQIGKVLNPGEIMDQTMTCMRSVYEVMAKADCRLSELAQLQIFYLAGSVPDEAAYRAQILEEFPECRDVLIVMTPVPSFATVGSEVEIDAIARKGARSVVTNEAGVVQGVRRGNWVFANSRVASAQKQICDGLRKTLEQLGCGIEDICRLYAYYPSDLDPAERDAIHRELAAAFAGAPPAYHATLLPKSGTPGLAVELEVIACAGGAKVVRKGRAVSPAKGLDWPFAEVVRCGGVVFASGQFPLDAARAIMHRNDIANQARVVMGRLETALKCVDTDMAHLVKIKTYYEGAWDKENWFENLRARMEKLSDPGPASSGIEGLLPVLTGALLSVDGIAVLDNENHA
jgi:enamine deaminase RidA (YjgF/YER057c/UK114 family)